MNGKKGQDVHENLLFLVFAITFVAVFFVPIVSYTISLSDVQSATEKNLESLGKQIRTLQGRDEKFAYIEHFPISIESEYAIIGFNSDYNAVKDLTDSSVSDDPIELFLEKEKKKKESNDDVLLEKPKLFCGRDSTCLCLLHKKDG